MGCYKDADEVVYYNNGGVRKSDIGASNINKSDGRGSNEEYKSDF